MPKYEIVKRNDDCIMLRNIKEGSYKIFDIEGDVICITHKSETAERVYREYSIEKVREERRKGLEETIKMLTN